MGDSAAVERGPGRRGLAKQVRQLRRRHPERFRGSRGVEAGRHELVEGLSDERRKVGVGRGDDDPAAAAIRARADLTRTTFEFGRPWLAFGLYLFRKP